MAKDGLTEKEAALIAAARRALNAPAAPGPQPAPARPTEPQPAAAAPEAPPPDRPDVAARVAALMQAEQDERQRNRKKLRLIGIAVPGAVLVAAILWVASAILRHIRS